MKVLAAVQILLAAASVLLISLQGASADVRVVATIKPLHSIAASVMAGTGAPDLILKGASTPHEYALRPSDASALQEADLVLWVGPDLETFLSGVMSRKKKRTQVIQAAGLPGITNRHYRHDTGHAKEKSETHGTEHKDQGHKHGHDHSGTGFDPHIWLDPANAAVIADAVAEALARLDPKNADRFRKNAQQTKQRLTVLEQEVRKSLQPFSKRRFVVFHDAYAHFEARFGLRSSGTVSIGDGRSPGAKRIANLRRLIRNKNVVCLFAEPQFPSKLVRVLVEGTNVRLGTLDPIGAKLKPGPELYFEMMKGNAAAAKACLG